jgi:hypothetical protein
VLVAHTCNPSYSGGREQKDHSSKPAQGIHSWDPISEKPFSKKDGGVVQGVGPEFKSKYCKKLFVFIAKMLLKFTSLYISMYVCIDRYIFYFIIFTFNYMHIHYLYINGSCFYIC